MKPSTRNVTRAFRNASVADLIEGRDWYERARNLARELDPHDIERAAGVIAALSPLTPWSRNQELARLAYTLHNTLGLGTGEGLPTLNRNGRKVAQILQGGDPDDILKGPKVRAFWKAIADPFAADAIVIDRHAIDVSLGHVTDDETRGRIVGRVGAYEAIASAYRQAAKILSRELKRDIVPSEVQAVTWLYWRRNHAAHKQAHNRGAWG